MKVVLRVTGGSECTDCLLNEQSTLLLLATTWPSIRYDPVAPITADAPLSPSSGASTHATEASLLQAQLFVLYYEVDHCKGKESYRLNSFLIAYVAGNCLQSHCCRC